MGAVERREFQRIAADRAPAWRRVAFLILGDWAGAEDVVQVALLRLSKAWHRIDPAGLEAFARTVVARLAIDEARTPHRRSERLQEPPEVEVPRPATEDALDIRAALEQLPTQQRAVLVLRYYADLSISDTAKALRISEGTVKSHGARGLLALRGHLDVTDPPGPVDPGSSDEIEVRR